MSTDDLEQLVTKDDTPLYDRVAEYCRAGMRIFPCRHIPGAKGDKSPAWEGDSWKVRATSDVGLAIEEFTTAAQRFGEDGVMVGWACGIDGYVVIDMDIPEADWPDWVAEVIDACAINITRKGQHLIAKFPTGMEPGNGEKKFPTAGWGEVRGAGGYVVVAGPDRPGFNAEDLDQAMPFPRPEWLTEYTGGADAVDGKVGKALLEATKTAGPNNSEQSKRGIITLTDPALWDRTRNGGAQGRHTTMIGLATQIAEESLQGLYPYPWGVNRLVAWFKEVKPGYGKSVNDALRWGIARALENLGYADYDAWVADLEALASAGAVGEEPTVSMNLSDDFWDARELLTHVRTAAYSMIRSPDGVLGTLLTRYAATVHPSIVLPRFGTLDLFAIAVSFSGGGKTQGTQVARRLYPAKGVKRILIDQPLGSGEGLIEMFFRWQDEEGNPCSPQKKGAEKVQHYLGAHFITDEGTALVGQAGRSGSIIIPTLCQAWAGETLGQRNAGTETTRVIPAGRARVAGQVNIQLANGHKLFAPEYASTGLSQRMWCVSARDSKIYENEFTKPEWPGELSLPRPFITGGAERVIGVPTFIDEEVDAEQIALHNPNWAGNPLDTHRTYLRLKLAALLALVDDRFEISAEDWQLADAMLTTSAQVRAACLATERQARRESEDAEANKVARTAVATDNARTKDALHRAVKRLESLREAEKSPMKRRLSGPQREFFEEAMLILEAQGLAREVHDGPGTAKWEWV